MFSIIGISSILIFFFGVLLTEAGTCYGAFDALRALCVGELALGVPRVAMEPYETKSTIECELIRAPAR